MKRLALVASMVVLAACAAKEEAPAADAAATASPDAAMSAPMDSTMKHDSGMAGDTTKH
ncbi:MAG: hypothetical protein IPK85_12145 [Gemmatimonadetes bacterium]|nr:hypothetical protein [Gemmatimonadota bacterium]